MEIYYALGGFLVLLGGILWVFKPPQIDPGEISQHVVENLPQSPPEHHVATSSENKDLLELQARVETLERRFEELHHQTLLYLKRASTRLTRAQQIEDDGAEDIEPPTQAQIEQFESEFSQPTEAPAENGATDDMAVVQAAIQRRN